MLDKQRVEQYVKFKEILSNQTTNTAQISVSDTSRDQVLDRARLFINRIKEQQHDKIKTNNKTSLSSCISKDMDAIIISPDINNVSTISITVPIV